MRLGTARTRTIAVAGKGSYFLSPTLSGHRVAAVKQTNPPTPRQVPRTDLYLIDLASGQITNLTHNTARSGQSLEPALWGPYLAFKQGPSPYDTGDIALWDMRHGHFPMWRSAESWRLDRDGERPIFGSGLLWWETRGQTSSAVLDFATRTIHLFTHKKDKALWLAGAGGGRRILLNRQSFAGHLTYYSVTVPGAC